MVVPVVTALTGRQAKGQGSSVVDNGKPIGAVNVSGPMAAVPPKDGIPAPVRDPREQRVRRVSSASKEAKNAARKSRTARTVPAGVTADEAVGGGSRMSGENSQVSAVVVKGDPESVSKTRRRWGSAATGASGAMGCANRKSGLRGKAW